MKPTPLTDEEIERFEAMCIDPVDANGWGFLNRANFARAVEDAVNAKWEALQANPVDTNPFAVYQIIQERNEARDMIRKVEELNADLMEQLETLQAKPVERNFCQRCGKRSGGMYHIHTCTPPADIEGVPV